MSCNGKQSTRCNEMSYVICNSVQRCRESTNTRWYKDQKAERKRERGRWVWLWQGRKKKKKKKLWFWNLVMNTESGFVPRTLRGKERRMGGTVPVVRFPIIFFIRLLGFTVAALLFTWTNHFRGGLALISDNKDLIFNVYYLSFLFSLFFFFLGIKLKSWYSESACFHG